MQGAKGRNRDSIRSISRFFDVANHLLYGNTLSSTSVHDNLKERERELRKQKEIEEQEMERVRVKVRRNEAVASFQALLVETIKDPQASWTESKPWLEKDPQGRATNPDLDPSDIEKLFREHIKMLHERCTNVFKDLLAEVIIAEAAAQKTEDGKTALDSWSTAKRLLKPDSHFASDIYRSHFLWVRCHPGYQIEFSKMLI
ncbi:pre-mRNA-processing protein 40C-like isoform X3 [Populus nigra]|uniref:pre-mRNA-processing protein 40C-like isoform X3 n=1 Tax=Populus nigra TaxID=3691 RepID=UPI002B279E10|nr:pre-mRNA-processing protein 40C-like isoform X3 [Populus nigra]